MADSDSGTERGVVFGERHGLHVRWRGGRVFALFVADDEVKVHEHDEDVPNRDAAEEVARELMRSHQHRFFR